MNLKYKYEISVIIVCHPQYHELLKNALQSLKNQTFDDFEIVIVWNGYDDYPQVPNEGIFKGLNNVVDIHCDYNLASACNYGVKVSRGEYIIRLDTDDKFDIQILKKEIQVFKRYGYKVDAVWCDFYRTYEYGMLLDEYSQYQPLPDLEHACGVLYRRTVFDALGGYDETLEYQEAFDFWRRFKQAGLKAVHINEPLYFYRQHRHSMSTNTSKRNQARINIIMDCK